MKRYTLPFVETKGILPIVKFSMEGGKDFYAIVDTGSESTLVDKTFKKEFPEAVKSRKVIGKTQYHGLSGSMDAVLVETLISLPAKTVEGMDDTIEMKCMINDLSALSEHYSRTYGFEGKLLMLLGSDVMRELGAVISLKKNTITFSVKEKRKLNKAC